MNHYGGGPTNCAFHQLHNGALSDGTKALLGIGLKFCPEAPTPAKDVIYSLGRLRESYRLRMWLDEEASEENQDYIPGLYESRWRAPLGDHDLESRLITFEIDLNTSINSRPPNCQYNLTLYERLALKNLKHDPNLLICDSDKNMGPSITTKFAYLSAI
jgi:hypothetical protein